MSQSGPEFPNGSNVEHPLQTTRQGDQHFGRVHADLLGFHHLVGRGMNHYNEAAELLREAGHDDLADRLLAPISRGVLTDRWSWSVIEEYEDRFFEHSADLEGQLRGKMSRKRSAQTSTNTDETETAPDGGTETKTD